MLGWMITLRWRWRIVIALAASVAVVLSWLLVPRRAQREQLLEAAWVEERSADPRPSHVAGPLPGTFGELLEPHLAALDESKLAYQRWGPAESDRVRRIYNGQDPISRLGAEASADLARHRAAMRGALRATRAQSARAPASLRLFGFFGPGEPFIDVQQAAKLAALDMLTLLDRGRADEAAEECVDALALGRDVSYPSVLGRMVGVAVTGISAHACGRALSAASATVVERVRAQLFAIRGGTPRFADILRREWLFQQLLFAHSDPRLPEGARVFIADAQNQSRTALDRLEPALFSGTAFEGQAARMAVLLDAQQLDWSACAERMEEVQRRLHWNPIIRKASNFVSLLRRHRDGFLKLDALACAASVVLERTRTGALPRDAASACPPIEQHAKCAEQSAPMHILESGGVPSVSVTLSDGSDYSVPLTRTPRGSAAVLR